MRLVTRPLLSLVAGFALLVGCSVDGPDRVTIPYPGPDSRDDGDGGDDSSGVTTGPTGPSSSSSSTGSGSSSSGNDATSSSSTGSTSSSVATVGATTGTGGGPNLCIPEPDDDICIACSKQECCNEVQDCAADNNCVCWVQCVEQTQGAIDQCIADCGLPGAVLLDLLDCSDTLCQAECGDLGI